MAGTAQTIIDLEKKFWEAMKDKDAKSAATMIADDGLVTGTQGPMRMSPAKYEQMTAEGNWTLEVVFPTDDVAVVAYRVHQTGTIGDGPMDMNCIDSSTWVKDGTDWKCADHTEIVVDDGGAKR